MLLSFASVDFATVFGTERWRKYLKLFYSSYDIYCQYCRNFLSRMKDFPGCPEFPDVIGAVPKGHEPGHTPSCQARFSFHWLFGSGMCDGEAPERRWSVQNNIAKSTREMGPGYRHDLLNMHNGDFNMQKLFKLSKHSCFFAILELIKPC